MKSRMHIESPDTVEATIKITMSLKDWADLRDQLNGRWPSSELANTITDLLGQMRRIVYPKQEA